MDAGHWTEDERERVADLLRQGFSRAGIAAATGITRNAVGGRIYRDEKLMAVSKSVKRKAKPKREPRERMHKPKTVNAQALDTIAERVQAMRQIPMPTPRLVALVDLKAAECKWPCRADKEAIGGQLFCGVETEGGGVWCPYHSFIGYTPPRSRHG